ncbi:hypothetical protein [Streptomyces sp. HUAS TT20]|uniref:hypothetical protein n=1 Tax=Streptomyces sp. HUAS TT20 TaxID=3447509 RepID=UPI0021D8AC22|nr:hypothetical protein [Streptomyces sp. HUAS 15-9]UXY30092.1 hypothetical protein N8I87_28435 [Streptomyces sp. HUAS 15-9]
MNAHADDVRAWLDEVWDRTEAALILRGGDGAGPLGRRPVPAEIYDDDALAELCVLTTTGDFTGDICRCLGSLTVALLDAEGEFLGGGSLHGEAVARERGRFRNDLTVADPAGLLAFLERHVAHPLKPPPVEYVGFRGE